MPDKEKNQKQSKEENQSKDENKSKVPEIELPDFQQYVQEDIPFNGIVKNLWEIKYDADAMIVLKESDAEEPTKEDYEWLSLSLNFGGLAFGGFSTVYDNKSFKQWNTTGWKDAKGNYRSVVETYKTPGKGTYRMGVQGVRNSSAIAQTKAIRLNHVSAITRSISNAAGGISVALSCKDMMNSKMEGAKVKVRGAFYDICFGCISFASGVGFVISGVYFVTDIVVKKTTGKKIHEHAESWFSQKMNELERNLQAEFWKFVNINMPHY
jgi:hypothetical protein